MQNKEHNMLKYIRFKATATGIEIEVTDCHVTKETDKIIWLDWKKNRTCKRKLVKTEVNKVLNYHSYGWAMKNIDYQCWCTLDTVLVMIKLMYNQAVNVIQMEIEERTAVYDRLKEWHGKPTYNVGLIKRGDVKNLW